MQNEKIKLNGDIEITGNLSAVVCGNSCIRVIGNGSIELEMYDDSVLDSENFEGSLYVKLYDESYLKDTCNKIVVEMYDNSRAEFTGFGKAKMYGSSKANLWNSKDFSVQTYQNAKCIIR